MIYSIVATLVLVLVYAYHDAKKISRGALIDSITHMDRSVFRAFMIVNFTFLGHGIDYGYIGQWGILLSALWVNLTIFWICFNISLNLMRGKNWNYIGQTAWSDRFFGPGIWMVQFIMLTMAVLVYLNESTYLFK